MSEQQDRHVKAWKRHLARQVVEQYGLNLRATVKEIWLQQVDEATRRLKNRADRIVATLTPKEREVLENRFGRKLKKEG